MLSAFLGELFGGRAALLHELTPPPRLLTIAQRTILVQNFLFFLEFSFGGVIGMFCCVVVFFCGVLCPYIHFVLLLAVCIVL